jgi:hypothetical protein
VAGRQAGRQGDEGERVKRDGASFGFIACEYWLVSQVGKVGMWFVSRAELCYSRQPEGIRVLGFLVLSGNLHRQ